MQYKYVYCTSKQSEPKAYNLLHVNKKQSRDLVAMEVATIKLESIQ